MRRLVNSLIVGVILSILGVPLAATLLGVDGADPQAENRTLAPAPAVPTSFAAALRFLPDLDAWFADHFAFRSTLIRWYGRSRYLWLGVSGRPTVAVGREGWLFYLADGGLEDFTNQSLLTEPELAAWRATVARERQWCDARGMAYAFTVAPDKTSVYPEHFPHTARRVNRMSRVDQVLTAVSDTGSAIDLRQALSAEKRRVRLFHKTDTHWNPRGAYVAYAALIEGLRVRVPSIPPPIPPSAFTPVTQWTPGMDLAGMIGLTRVLWEEDLALAWRQPHRYVVREPAGNIVQAGEPRIVTEIPGSTLPTAVVIRDSFASAMAPFLSEHFSRVVYVWQKEFAPEVIAREHPDVVVHEIVGRFLQWYVPDPALIPAR